MSLKSLILYGSDVGPNPYKVEIILQELGLSYENNHLDFPELKKPEYESKNPNGRLPALTDPNTGLTLWESGAIIQYLIETYDKEHKISSAAPGDKWLEYVWLQYQMSGQGPYWGQYVWFGFVHPEKFPSAIERYKKEIKRVVMVLDRELRDNNKEWLVGGKCTYADLSFTVWHWVVFMADEALYRELEAEFPAWKAWEDRMQERPIVAKLFQQRLAGFKKLMARWGAQTAEKKAAEEKKE